MNGNPLKDRKYPLVIGHRGAPMKEIENTIASFSRALKDGADGVELDVHLTGDGEIIVQHDYTTKRVWGIDGEIEELTLKDIKAINNEIPTLDEVFDSIGPVWYDIEIKGELSFDKNLITKLTDTLLNWPTISGHVMVSSFNPLLMRSFWKQNKERYPLGIIYEGPPTSVPLILQSGQGRYLFECDFLKPKWDIAEKEAKAKKGKYPLVPWCVDNEDVLERMLALGVAALITNESEMVVRSLRARGLREDLPGA